MRRVLTLLLSAVLIAACADDQSRDSTEKGEPETSTYKLQVESVPGHLRHLVPLAEKWGIGDDVERAEFIARASAAERRALTEAITPHQGAITAWLDSFGMNPMTDEAAAFMYMQLAVEELGGY